MRVLLFCALLFSSVTAVRADSGVGCGLGSLIWKDNSIISALFAATTNHSFSSQLFGITTGTSGCSQHSIVKRDMYPVYYAEANLPELRHEMAIGSGEYLSTFAQVLGCDAGAQVEFATWAQNSYGVMFAKADNTSAEFLQGLKAFKSTKAAASCNNLAVI
jgi:Protein of unknown function (DUF3015)